MRKLMIATVSAATMLAASACQRTEAPVNEVNVAEEMAPVENAAENLANAADNVANAADNAAGAVDNAAANATDLGSTDHGSTDHGSTDH